MAYRSNFEDITYPDETGAPCVLQFRFAFASLTRLLVVVHLAHTDPTSASPATSAIVRDQLLNRILTDRLAGVPISAIRLAVTDSNGCFEYAIEVDVDDYIRRGNPYDAGQIKRQALGASSGARSGRKTLLPAARVSMPSTLRLNSHHPKWPAR
jgi:hypothetical protein